MRRSYVGSAGWREGEDALPSRIHHGPSPDFEIQTTKPSKAKKPTAPIDGSLSKYCCGCGRLRVLSVESNGVLTKDEATKFGKSMHCPICKAKPPNQRFCKVCGKEIDKAQAEADFMAVVRKWTGVFAKAWNRTQSHSACKVD